MTTHDLAPPTDDLAFGNVVLKFIDIIPGEPHRGFMPYYNFNICLPDGTRVGHINFRVGNSEHVRLIAGHVGYTVSAPHRGHGYAADACRALGPLIKTFYPSVIITTDPDNFASIRTVENIGGRFINEVKVPANDPHYHAGSRAKRRYEWTPG